MKAGRTWQFKFIKIPNFQWPWAMKLIDVRPLDYVGFYWTVGVSHHSTWTPSVFGLEGIDDEDVLRVREELLRVQFQRQLPWDHRQLAMFLDVFSVF